MNCEICDKEIWVGSSTGTCPECLQAIIAGTVPDEEDEGPNEPEEGDLVTDNHEHFWGYGMSRRNPVVVVEVTESWQEVVNAHMQRENFYPDIWFMSEDGNYHPISLEDE